MRIGVDLGGSHIAVGLVNNTGNILDKIEKDWTADDRKDIKSAIKNAIINLSNEILKNNNYKFSDIEKIGIGSPGTIMQGKICNATNLGIDIFDIKKELEEEIDVSVSVRNDAKCAAICEKKFGNIKNYSDAVFLVLGTGLGGAVFLNDKLLEPKRYSGFEVGHMTIIENGEQCTCGKKGCFERYASMRSFKKRFIKEFNLEKEDLHSKEVFEIIEREKENPIINEILEDYIGKLTTGIANLIDLFEPEAVCIGGGFMYYQDLLLPLLKENLKNNKTFNKGNLPEITIAKMGNDAGIIGAAMQD